ncbi:MAG: nicotinate phosphoribosyltransferase [Chloroflexi bacterium]|nr:nicotinate phosphoribosyltransferase [Chloroflexota bacterium]
MPRKDLTSALFTDLYQLTMAQAYWQSGHTAPATFSLYFRSYPPDRAYFVFAGLADVLEYLESFQLTGDDIAFLRSLGLFDGDFLTYLQGLRFTGAVRAMKEGAIFFAEEPVVEVTAPVIEAQIAETFVVNQVNLQTLLATKASRVVHAARGRTVVDFAARRTHGTEAADRLARVSYMAGFAGTSNVLAGGRYDIPVYGTMAHSFVTTFESETDAFRAYAASFPDTSTFLVDTYDTLEGTLRAIEVGKEMRARGHALRAIRLDSGDLLDLSVEARRLLDEAGLSEVQVFASGGLDESEIEALLEATAPIDGFGVGTKVGVSADAPYADSVYKIVEYDGRPVLKLSTGKETLPGSKQVYRSMDVHGSFVRDVIASAPSPGRGGTALLAEVMRGGQRCAPSLPLHELRENFAREFARLPARHKVLRSPAHYPVEISAELEHLRSRVVSEVQGR